ncbi:hypothetical protein QJS04_geneDACA019014 [Acorus gramineus]|uniref:TF-B3 domain-containing protein n=1 Tax=Acorus gramineus TaxID=55184 RepID=A0AAV9BC35_ACOGR|nr:hypothetical protein QJS04_geneDACA019014 [Acorus gramineus]
MEHLCKHLRIETMVLKTGIMPLMQWLPRNFSKAYLPKNSTEMRLVVPKAGEWSVNGLLCTLGRFVLSRRWPKFYESNGLKVGDSLVFELVRETEMLVHIFRA